MFFIPAIAIGVEYSTLLDLTPISYMVVIKGMKKRQEIMLKQQDELNYLLSAYILSGVAGKPIKEPLFASQHGGLEYNQEEKAKNDFYNKKMIFESLVNKANKKFERKED